MEYAYVRVSTSNQKIDRQMDEILRFGVKEKNIFIDKQSGKDFNREKYQKLLKKLRNNELLVIKSIDRLGRNYTMIVEEWARITKSIGADILVLDMPLLDTRQKKTNLMGRFISDIVLQLLSFVAENERDNIRQRQAEGIKVAKAKGVRFGRPKITLPTEYPSIMISYKKHEITNFKASKMLGISRGTFFRLLKTENRNI